ncbi:hypothetical protein [Streptomyces hundungensis]|uniref:hypothetical protein n=1 Tax=Streptomyces hundungensis TaxID=1077946 RepID=UPI000EAA9D32|nr:hypothetical protein [Streptomyces hundungensis]
MHRGLVHGLAWSLATGAAVTLSWWGVHTVMAGTAYDPPRALPISGDARIEQGSRPDASSTRRPRESPSPSSSAPAKPTKGTAASDKPSSSSSSSPGSSGAPKSASMSGTSGTSDDSADSGAVRGYNVAGGRVVFDLGDSSAQLVSATPASGWRMERWIQTQWIRVTFTRGSETVSVFCTWNGHPPMVEINNT